MKNIITTAPSISMKKNGEKVIIGIGILTKNPTIVTKDELKSRFHHIVYVYYDGYWYHTPFVDISQCQIYLNSKKTYSKEQLFEAIYNITMKNNN